MSPYKPPSEARDYREEMRQRAEERRQMQLKADRYDRLVEADERGGLVRMTTREYNRITSKLELLDYVDRESIRKAMKRQKREAWRA